VQPSVADVASVLVDISPAGQVILEHSIAAPPSEYVPAEHGVHSVGFVPPVDGLAI